jgi:16S rRNA (cytosine967-C5)-methyltransferase
VERNEQQRARAPSAREIAARVVEQVLSRSAYVSDVLHEELSRSGLEPRDRALATELAYGVIRTHPFLAERLAVLANRGVAPGDTLAQAHLWVAAYQLLLLRRVPAFAAIDQAVGSLRRLRGARFSAFANAVLRRLAETPPASRSAALTASVPRWLFDALVGSVGEAQALALLGAAPEAGESAAPHRGLSVRLRNDRALEHGWLRAAAPGKVCESARWLAPQGDLRRLSGYAEGDFVVQEEGSQWAALALGCRPGERVYDACAGHGQKAAILAEQLGRSGQLWVSDRGKEKLERLASEFRRLALPVPESRVLDLTQTHADIPGDMDRVLVDAPCSGTGTLRRRPEIMFRLGPEDPPRLAQLALTLLRNAAGRARPGGRVLFVVCSVLHWETQGLLEGVSDLLVPAPFDSEQARRLAGADATHYQLLPGRDGTDGYFVASFVRRS